MSSKAESAEPSGIGLRERRKALTRREIQVHALQLFAERGYELTTVEQIADAAMVSESTFYRYFPTKADVVFTDELDPLILSAFENQPSTLSAAQALTAALRSVLSQLTNSEVGAERERLMLFWSVPELRAAALEQLLEGIEVTARLVAERSGRESSDTEVRALAGAVVGAAVAGLLSVASHPEQNAFEVVSLYLDHFEAALRL